MDSKAFWLNKIRFNQQLKRYRPISVLLYFGFASLFISAPVTADGDSDSHWYLGGQMGWGLYQNACGEQALDCDDNSAASGIFGGYQFSSRWQLEASYLNPGDAATHYPRLTTGPLVVTGDMDIADLSVLYNLPLSPQWLLQLRGGAAYWEAETESREFSFASDGVSASAGAALEWAMNESWAGRVGYQYLHDVGDEDTGGSELHLFSVGLRYRFGAAPAQTRVGPAVVAAPASGMAMAQSIPLAQPVYFEFNRDYTNQLGQLAPIVDRLKQNPQTRVEVIGYSDSRGEANYNQDLSRRRAEFVAGYLQSHGIERGRIGLRAQGENEINTGLGQTASDQASRRVLVRILETEVQP